jgi:hypothetical protein
VLGVLNEACNDIGDVLPSHLFCYLEDGGELKLHNHGHAAGSHCHDVADGTSGHDAVQHRAGERLTVITRLSARRRSF